MMTMPVTWGDFEVKPSATYAYVQLADWITEHIRTGCLASGDRLPSQRQLGELTGTSTELAGKTMTVLRDRGLVETSIRGTFIR